MSTSTTKKKYILFVSMVKLALLAFLSVASRGGRDWVSGKLNLVVVYVGIHKAKVRRNAGNAKSNTSSSYVTFNNLVG